MKCTKHLGLGALLEVEMSKKCTPLWREAHFEVKMYKTPQCRTTFGSCDVEKVHAVVARAHFEVKMYKTPQFRSTLEVEMSKKSGRCCGAKQISKSKCTKHTILGPLLEVAMSKKCTPLWHISKSKVQKTEGYGALLDVQMSLRVAGARDCAPCQK